MKTSQFLGFLSAILVVTHAINSGTPDFRNHTFAAFLAMPNAGQSQAVNCTHPFIYFSCGATLVNIDGLPQNRILLTNGNCMFAKDRDDSEFYVSFAANQVRVRENCQFASNAVVGYSTPGYSAKHFWTPFDGTLTGNGVLRGQIEDNFALVLLDKTVSPKDAVAARITTKTELTSANIIPIVGLVAYGMVGYGANGTKFGQPDSVNGPREKMYVEMKTTSVSPTLIGTSMPVGTVSGGICYGDLGAGLFDPDPQKKEIYAVAATVDNYCRAVSTSVRVGTQRFWDWVDTVRADIINHA